MIAPLPRCISQVAALLAASLTLSAAPLLAGTPVFTTIHTFDPAIDGNITFDSMIQGADGRLYGTNSADGQHNNGTVFAIKLDGTGFTVLASFPNTNGGEQPRGGVVQARDGNFYGTTYAGGSNGDGVLYQVTPAGTLTYLDSFNNASVPGANPGGTMVEGLDGLLYGSCQYGGIDNFGTIFTATVPGGVLSTLAPITGGTAGEYPVCDMIQGSDDNFYGTTSSGGTDTFGTFFQVTLDGALNTLWSFTGSADGGTPIRGVVEGPDGAFYGVCQTGGSSSSGAIYRLAVTGTTATVTALYDFDPILGDGSSPDAGLVVGSDGNLYGTTAMGGSGEAGTVFKVTTTGAFNTVYDFTNGDDGGFPVGGLTLGSNGELYGTTAGENGSSGTIFKIAINLPIPPPVLLGALTTVAQPGQVVYLKGDYFVGTTAVTFSAIGGGTTPAASFTDESKTIIAAVVPTNAASGAMTVTANGLTTSSAFPITISGGSTPPVTPEVSLDTKIAIASETGPTSAKVKFVRSGTDFSAPLTVKFKIKGSSTAIRGTDYILIPGAGAPLDNTTNSVTIPAGSAKLVLKITPLETDTSEPFETVVIKLVAESGYTVSSAAHKSTITILDTNTGE